MAGMNHKDETVKSDSYTNTSVIDRINFQPPLAPLPERPFEEMSLSAGPERYGTKHEKSPALYNRDRPDGALMRTVSLRRHKGMARDFVSVQFTNFGFTLLKIKKNSFLGIK